MKEATMLVDTLSRSPFTACPNIRVNACSDVIYHIQMIDDKRSKL